MSYECSCLGAWIVCVFYCSTFVSVIATPFIDVRPSSFSTTLVYGSQNTISVYLRCEVSHLEQYHRVTWFKNNRQISENVGVFESELTDLRRYNIVEPYNLRISPITYLHAYKDSGNYQCRVLNADNTAVTESGIVDITINVNPGGQYPICKQFVNELHFHGHKSEYFSGDIVTLQCLSDPGKPQVILQWFRNDETTPLSTWVKTSTEFNVRPMNNYTLDLSTEESGTEFRCQLLQPARNCTIGPITIYDEPTINIYPEIFFVHSCDQAVTFTCSVERGDPKVINYRWTVKKVGHNSLISDSQLFNLSDGNTIKLSRFQSSDSGEYNITCVVDYGFSSRDASASLIVNISFIPPATNTATLTTSMLTPQTPNSSASISLPAQSTAQKQTPHITSPTSDRTENTNTSVIIIASSVSGLGFLLLLTIVILAVRISKSRKTNQPTRNAEIILNQHIEVNVIAHPPQENQTLHLRENIAYDSVDDQGGRKNIYLNTTHESVQNTLNDESPDDGRQVQTLQALENIACESTDDHGQDQDPYSRDNIAYEGADGSDNNRNSIFPEKSPYNGEDDPGNHQTSHLLENAAYESVDNHGKDQTTNSCENIAYESADGMVNNRNSKFGENIAFESASVQWNDHAHLVDNVAYESVDTYSEHQLQYLSDNGTQEATYGFDDDRTVDLRDDIAYESADDISAKDTAYAEGNLYETLEKKVSPTPDGNKEDGNKNVDRPVRSNNNTGQLREVGGQESVSGRQLTTD